MSLKAPWKYLPEDDGAPIVDAAWERVCDLDCLAADTDEEEERNARRQQRLAALIAAAPDMLAALEELVSRNYGQPSGVHVNALDVARAVIKQAKGEV